MFHTASTLQLRSDLPTGGLCGPRALRSVLRAMGVPAERLETLSDVVPTRRGTSLLRLRTLAARVGVPMRCVWGASGARLPSNAVAHTAGHFIAILSANGETNPVLNPAASRDLGWRPPTGLDATFSGYLLVPEGCALDRGWREVGDEEADGVWGRGDTVLTDLGHYGAQDLMNTGGVCRGIARYDFHGLLAALHVEDTPVWIDAPFGPQLVFTIAYNQADVYLSAQRTPSGLPLKWTHNWNHFIRFTHRMGGSAIGSSVAHLFRGGGGVERYLFDGDNAESNAEVRATSRLSRTIATRTDPSGKVTTSVVSCSLRHPDGSIEEYEDSDGQAEPTLRLTRLIDPQGNEVGLTQLRKTLKYGVCA